MYPTYPARPPIEENGPHTSFVNQRVQMKSLNGFLIDRFEDQRHFIDF